MDASQREIAEAIGQRIKTRRNDRGESQEDVSVRSGLHRTAVGQLERGERVPRVDTLLKLAGSLDVSIGDLVGPLVWSPGEYLSGGFRVGGGDAESGS